MELQACNTDGSAHWLSLWHPLQGQLDPQKVQEQRVDQTRLYWLKKENNAECNTKLRQLVFVFASFSSAREFIACKGRPRNNSHTF